MRTADFDFDLPPELIAQEPLPQRDEARLLILHRDSGVFEHRLFCDLPDYLEPGDVLVLNNSRVIPARLRGANTKTGGAFEVLLLTENGLNDWWVLLRPGKRARVGTPIRFRDTHGELLSLHATVVETNAEGHRRLRFSGTANILDQLEQIGEVPLPPYIDRSRTGPLARDQEDYQTIFAGPAGSVAAPTAGLHFTRRLLERLRTRGIHIAFVTLHVGLGTFAPVKVETISAHVMHEERYELNQETASLIHRAKQTGRRVVAVGTTTVRVLETLALEAKRMRVPEMQAATGSTTIFIYPPYDFKIVDILVTNFHLPRSTLLMLASAFAAPNHVRGRDLLLAAYAEAVRERYRFFSYGDAMLIV